MAERDLLDCSNVDVHISDEVPLSRRPGTKFRPAAIGGGKREAAGGSADGMPDPKRPRIAESETGSEFEKVMQRLKNIYPDLPVSEDHTVTDKGETGKRRELKIWAEITVKELPIGDLQYYLQCIKRKVQQTRGNTDAATQQQNRANQGGLQSRQNDIDKAPSAIPAGPSDCEGSEKNKPTLSGSFYPLNNLDGKDREKKHDEEKAFQRPRAEKRSAEEEQEYQDLLHSIAEKPVMVDGHLDNVRFEEVITKALRVTKKLKDWFSIWSNCAIKGDAIVSATVYLTNRLCVEKTEEDVADILGHLMKEKEIPPKQMEIAIQKFASRDKEMAKIMGHLLTFIYPTPKGDFGWSRVGWGFAQWWGQGKKFIKDLDKPVDALKLCVDKLVEYKADFTGEKQEKILAKVTEILGTRQEAVDILGIKGDESAKPSPSPVTDE